MHTKTKKKEIAERLRLARQRAGYNTISEFIQKYKFAKTTYTQYEIGTRTLHIELAIQFTTLFKTNLIWLLTGKGSIDCTDDDLINFVPEKISQDEFLSILTQKNNLSFTNHKGNLQKKIKTENIQLLAGILSKIMQCYKKQAIALDFDRISEITFGIYFDIINKTNDRKEQQNIIDAAISTFNRMLCFKQQAG